MGLLISVAEAVFSRIIRAKSVDGHGQYRLALVAGSGATR